MKRSKKEVQPNWHPNFRIQSRLPDIKPIRTGFLINFAAVIICIGLGFLVLQQELRRISLNNSISVLQTTVNEHSASNQAYLSDSRKFANEVSKLQELEAFYDAPFAGYELLIALAEVRPDNLIYDNINFTESVSLERRQEVKVFRIQINGKSKDLATLGRFKEAVSELDFVRANDGSVNETIFPRDENTGVFPYTIVIDF